MKFQDFDLRWLGNSGFLISGKKKIYIDPEGLSESEKADIILITHPHYDHCSIEDIQKILKEGSVIVCPADCQSKLARLEGNFKVEVLDVGQSIDLGVKIGAVPAYNLNKGYHSKDQRWLGYLILLDGLRIYHAGDTDLIPEMNRISADIALLPVGGTFTMNAKEAAEAASIINPTLAVPMHYGEVAGTNDDAKIFAKLCHEKNIKSEILDKE